MRTRAGGRFVTGLVLGTSLALAPVVGTPTAAAAPETVPPAEEPTLAQPDREPQPERQPQRKPEPGPPKDTTPPAPPTVGYTTVGPEGAVAMVVTAEAGAEIRVTDLTDRITRVATETATGSAQTLEWQADHGSRVYKLLAVDAARNASPERIISVKVDARGPKVRTFRFTPGNAEEPLSQLRVIAETGAAYTLVVDDEVVRRGTIKGGELETALDLADGRHAIRLELEDATGNVRTFERDVTVEVGALSLDVEHVSDPTEATQVFEVTGPIGTTGVLQVGEAASSRFDLGLGTATVRVTLPDGEYRADVSVTDAQGRSGGARVPAFSVDTTPPTVSLSVDPIRSAEGTFAADLTTEEGSRIDWELTTADGTPVDDGFIVGTGSTQRIERPLEEGSYELRVSVADALGNTAQDEVRARVTAAPLVSATTLAALLGVLLLLLTWLLLGLLMAVRRTRRTGSDPTRTELLLAALRPWRTAAQEHADKTDHRAAVAAYVRRAASYEEDLRRWTERRGELGRLLEAAEGGGEPVDADLLPGVPALPGERLLAQVPVTVVEGPTDRLDDLEEREGGTLLVTDRRLVLDGAEPRTWDLAEVERVRHLGGDHTLFRLWGEDGWAGIGYAEEPLARSYLQIALAGDGEDRASLARTFHHGLAGHDMLRPQPPVHPDARASAAEHHQDAEPVHAREVEGAEHLDEPLDHVDDELDAEPDVGEAPEIGSQVVSLDELIDAGDERRRARSSAPTAP